MPSKGFGVAGGRIIAEQSHRSSSLGLKSIVKANLFGPRRHFSCVPAAKAERAAAGGIELADDGARDGRDARHGRSP